MKHKFKKYLQYGLLLIGLPLIIYTCQKEDDQLKLEDDVTQTAEQLYGKKLLVINAKDIPVVMQTIASEGKGLYPKLEPKVTAGQRNLDTTNPFGTIDDSVIRALEDLQGNRTYTFRIIPYTKTPNVFYNLIVVTDIDGDVIKSYIKEYESYNNEKFSANFTGKSSKYELDGTFTSNKNFEEGEGGDVPDCIPCVEEEEEEEDDYNDTTEGPDGEETNTGGGGGETSNGDPTDPGDTDDGTGDTNSGDDGSGDSGDGGTDTSGEYCGGDTPKYSDCSRNYTEVWMVEFPGGSVVPVEMTVDCCGNTVVSTKNGNTIPNPNDLLPCCDEDVIVIEEVETPCEELKKLLENTSTKDAIEQLEADVSDHNYEKGYSFTHDSNLQSSANPINSLTDSKIRFFPKVNWFSAGHSHNENSSIGSPPYPMFSYSDILVLYKIATTYWFQGADPNYNIFSFVMTTDQGTYAISINDMSKLQEFGDNFNNNINKIVRKYTRSFERNTTSPNDWDSKQQKAFLKFITEDFDIGIDLYKANDDLTNWTKLVLDENGDVGTTGNCP